jgi:hypothetical protein
MKANNRYSLFFLPVFFIGLGLIATAFSMSAYAAADIGEVRTGGEVFIKMPRTDWTLLKEKFSFSDGTEIRTEDGFAYIRFIDGSMIDVANDSTITIKGSPASYSISIEKGTFAFNIDPSAKLSVNMPSLDILVGGGGSVQAEDELNRIMGVVSTDRLSSEVKGVSGRLSVTYEGKTEIIDPREKMIIDWKGETRVVPVASKNLFIGCDADYRGFIGDVLKDMDMSYIGRIISYEGDVSIIRRGSRRGVKSNEGLLLDDIIETGEDASVDISLIDDGLLSLREETKLRLEDFEFGRAGMRGRSTFYLFNGAVRTIVGNNYLEIYTPTGVAVAKGTIIILEVIDGKARLYVVEHEATYTFLTPEGLSEIIHEVDEGYMYGDGLIEPVPIPPVRLLEEFQRIKLAECGICEKPDALGGCIPDMSIDPGPCLRCENGNEVVDDSEDPGMCRKCSGGQVVNDNAEDPGVCKRCSDGVEVADDTEDPGTCKKCRDGVPVNDDDESLGDCQKCVDGQVVPDTDATGCEGVECGVCERVDENGECIADNERDPGMCLKCLDGVAVPDDDEDPGLCQRCENGIPVADDLEDPGMCRKCEGGQDVADNSEDPGLCLKCENGISVADDLEDPGVCRKCENGLDVPDDFEDPGLCQKCENGAVAEDDLEDPGICLKCEGGLPVAYNDEDPGLCLKCEGGVPVADDIEDPGICYKCFGGSSVVDNSEPCDDNDQCTINDRCFAGSCIGDLDPSPVDPECF